MAFGTQKTGQLIFIDGRYLYVLAQGRTYRESSSDFKICVKGHAFGQLIAVFFRWVNWLEEKDYQRLKRNKYPEGELLPKTSLLYWTYYLHNFANLVGYRLY